MSLQWQPIETAPKDRYLLVYGTGIIGIACWSKRDQRWHAVGVDVVMTPTHWMPLPTPPRSPSDEEQKD